MTKRRKYRIKIDIACDSRAEYISALTAIRQAKGTYIDTTADVTLHAKGVKSADIRDLFDDRDADQGAHNER